MRVIGLADVLLSAIRLPGGMRELAASEEVGRRAESIKAIGMIHEPLVRKRDMKLLIGRRRIAACMRNGAEKVRVKLVDCTDEEAEVAVLAENAEREHNPSKANVYYLEMIELLEKQGPLVPPEPPKEEEPKKAGRPKTKRRIAMEMIAKQKGVTLGAMKQATRRKKKRAEKFRNAEAGITLENPIVPVTKYVPPVKTLGMELVNDWCAKVKALQDRCESIDMLLRETQTILTRLSRMDYADEAFCQRIYELVSKAAADARSMRPTSLCPYCKGLPRVSEECVGCRRTAYLMKRDDHDIPPELLDEENPKVSFHGEVRPTSDFVDQGEPLKGTGNMWGLE